MAKKIKFPLKLADGAEVRSLEELKEHFDIESVVGYFNDGRLLTWLRSRYYEPEADQIERLDKGDSQLHKKLYAIFGVESKVEEIDVEKIAERQKRLNRLKQYTYDKEILERVDLVAFDQEDLSDLLDEEKPLIYLCGNKFVIPLRETHKTYIGVGKAIAVIRSNKIVDFDSLNIEFKNITFDDNYAALLKERELAKENKIAVEKRRAEEAQRAEEKRRVEEEAARPKKLFDEGEKARENGNFETALKKYKESAESGYAKAFGELGIMYYFGFGVDKNIDTARHFLRQGMDKGDGLSFGAYASFIVANILADKNVTKFEKLEAFRCMKHATEIEADNGDWWYNLGEMYNRGIGTEKNIKAAIRCLEKGAELGNSDAATLLGVIYHDGKYVEENPRKAFELYKRAFELKENNVPAVMNLATCYGHGYGVAKNEYKAFELYKRAANLGNTEAMATVGYMLIVGDGVPKDEQESFTWTRKAAEAGNSMAMMNLAGQYIDGKGIPKNISKAIEWYTKAAELGNSEALVHLGEIYHDDDCGITDYQKAAFYFKKAADAGNGEGMNDLGLLYDWGHGVAEDKKLAFQWYLRGAEAGFLAGMAHVGRCYLRGEGTSKNMSKAAYWLKKAAEGGNYWGMFYYGDYFFEIGNSSALDWYKKVFDKKEIGEIAYKIYKIYKDGKCGVAKNSSQADYWERKYKSLGYKPDDGCFITTAVCENFGKPDDCYELTTFRKFRDGWLVSQPDGKNLIAEYYSIAPAIVEAINRLDNAAQFYKNLWQKYLAPCLTFIEQGDNQSCKRLYVDMVTSLKKKFS